MRALVFCVVLTVAAPAAATADGVLQYGPHSVGFRSFVREDRSRPAVRVGTEGSGRSIRIDLWYPSGPPGTAATLTVGRYARLDATSPDVAGARDEYEMRARADAPAPTAVAPLVVYAHTEAWRKAVLAEYLASHGYAVASPATQGTWDRDLDPSMADIETQARDVEFTIATLSEMPWIDRTRVVTAGMSFGALSALLVAMRNPTVDGVVSLDGGIGSTPNVENFGFDRSPFHDRIRFRVPLLHLYGTGVAGTQLDYVRSLRYAERHLVPFEVLDHGDFAGNAFFSGDPRKTKEFSRVATTVLEFVRRVTRNVREAWPDGVQTLSADPAPPTLEEIRNLVRAGGGASLRGRDVPLDLLRKTASWLNDHRRPGEARDVLLVAAEAHPKSARIHFALGVVLATLGDPSGAASHLERAVELASSDSTLDAAARKRIVDGATERLKTLPK